MLNLKLFFIIFRLVSPKTSRRRGLIIMSGSGDRSVLTWTISDVRSWLTDQGMARYAKVFCDQHRIDGPALLMIQVNSSD